MIILMMHEQVIKLMLNRAEHCVYCLASRIDKQSMVTEVVS